MWFTLNTSFLGFKRLQSSCDSLDYGFCRGKHFSFIFSILRPCWSGCHHSQWWKSPQTSLEIVKPSSTFRSAQSASHCSSQSHLSGIWHRHKHSNIQNSTSQMGPVMSIMRKSLISNTTIQIHLTTSAQPCQLSPWRQIWTEMGFFLLFMRNKKLH